MRPGLASADPTFIVRAVQLVGVTEPREPADEPPSRTTDARDELRTIAFRLRELQRLVAARVEQEDRRLEAEGLEPVGDHRSPAKGEPVDDAR